MPRMDLEGSSSIITGGASGIGEASARQLAAAGSRVVIADLNEDRGTAVASELGGLFVRCDVTSVEDADTAVAAASEMGPLRAVVNSAGLGYAGRTIDRSNDPLDLEKFRFVINGLQVECAFAIDRIFVRILSPRQKAHRLAFNDKVPKYLVGFLVDDFQPRRSRLASRRIQQSIAR